MLVALALAAGAGCQGDGLGPQASPRRFLAVHETGPVEEPQPADVVIERVNQNSAAMAFLLKAGGVDAKGRYVEYGHTETYDLDGTLLYRKPRDLYLELNHALGGKIEFGSNDQEFWVWKRLGKERYWWGRQASIDANQELNIPLRPTDIVDVLGLGRLDLPDRSAFKVRDDRYEIRLTAQDAWGFTRPVRRISIDRRAPFLVREMIYYSPEGRPRVEAALSDYTPVGENGPLVPRRIHIHWPEKGSEMSLEFATLQRFRETPAVLKRFTSPVQQGRDVGRMERVDQPPPRAER